MRSNQNGRRPFSHNQPPDAFKHNFFVFFIEPCRRLIEQIQRLRHDERPCQAEPPPLSSTQLPSALAKPRIESFRQPSEQRCESRTFHRTLQHVIGSVPSKQEIFPQRCCKDIRFLRYIGDGTFNAIFDFPSRWRQKSERQRRHG